MPRVASRDLGKINGAESPLGDHSLGSCGDATPPFVGDKREIRDTALLHLVV